MLKIQDLRVSVVDKEIIQGIDLTVNKGEIHALMGKNGSGKSTLAQTIMGSPLFQVNSGSVSLNGKEILKMSPDERAALGIFLSFQYPSEIIGVNVLSYLRMLYIKRTGQKISPVGFKKIIKEKMELLHMKEDFLTRYLNDGFSGGEKKRMEMLQMLILEPEIAILDEVDSGLDIDSLKIVADAVNYLYGKTKMSVLVITHYVRILKFIVPDYVHVMGDGKLVKTGGSEVAQLLEDKGYSSIL
jgi:Fe-S cluster assembly ATP-binding protein